MKKILLLFLLLSGVAQAQQKEIRIYDGPAPGSENWNWVEKKNNANAIKLMTVFNVVNPSITVFPADPAVANGTSVIICPGGGFHFLSIDNEGNDVATWLAKKGVTAFVLKYRTAYINTDDPFADMMAGINGPRKAEWDAENKATIPLSIADGKAAIAYVRKHAADYGIDPNRIGILGFSAGGTVTASAAFNYTPENKPAFVAPIYPYMPASLQGTVAADAPRLFAVCASDDQLNLAPHSVELYSKWLAAKQPAELHMYAKGGHGFGMNKQNIPTDHWIDRFADWLAQQGFMTQSKK
ncbi:alpha/beta hydrolase [Spirosoma foliorum]|uniref:Alpha/beta hydrolase n=1 Tax=Spirosoma foliorum TaxID=2710596 RepID=A0A7G5H4X5_9BACT|nr:alpha/beta hydrolase [Spirosoma foliorum]QMW06167.1 alpha/beta hydrolase [Spirosoma foliorum]